MSVANEMMIIGSDQPITIDFKELKQRMAEPAVAQTLRDIYIPDAHSLLSNIWFLEKEMLALSDGRSMITDNRPRIEFYLNYGKVIGREGLERLVFNRTPLAEVRLRISGMEYEDKKRFKQQYQAMDLYQRASSDHPCGSLHQEAEHLQSRNRPQIGLGIALLVF